MKLFNIEWNYYQFYVIELNSFTYVRLYIDSDS